MKKCSVLVSLLVLLVLLPVMAAPMEKNSWSAGINLGSGVQSVGQYKINDELDILVGLGLDFFSNAVVADATANYKITEFAIGKADFDVTVGGGVLLGFYNSKVELALIVPVGITYKIADDIIPLDVYLRIGPTIRILKGYQSSVLGIYSYIGAIYRF